MTASILREQTSKITRSKTPWRCCTTDRAGFEQQQGQARNPAGRGAMGSGVSSEFTASTGRHQPSPTRCGALLPPRTTTASGTGYQASASPRAAPCSAAYWGKSSDERPTTSFAPVRRQHRGPSPASQPSFAFGALEANFFHQLASPRSDQRDRRGRPCQPAGLAQRPHSSPSGQRPLDRGDRPTKRAAWITTIPTVKGQISSGVGTPATFNGKASHYSAKNLGSRWRPGGSGGLGSWFW